MNIPVPPIFLYEKSLGNFEVMDGQQRLNAISTFYAGEFSLQGLKIWQALNGKTYSQLPPLVRRGLDRAKVSAITLMSDSSSTAEDSIDLRAQVFDRLNTGGERLNAQELRNALFSGRFNELIISLAKHPVFCRAWEIPPHEENLRADGSVSPTLERNSLYRRMQDVEIVLRFFAFRNVEEISGSVRAMLDDTQKRNRFVSVDEVNRFETDFLSALDLCSQTFGDDVFRIPSPRATKGALSRTLYDAQMVSMHLLAGRREEILAKSPEIRSRILRLARPGREHYELLIGRANTAAAIRDRILLVKAEVEECLNG